jgi:hypothetical protein
MPGMDGTTTLYAIHVAGRLGATTLAAFPDLVGEQHGPETVLTGQVADGAALYGIIARLEALGLELIEMRRLTPAPTRPHRGSPGNESHAGR